MNCGHIYIFMNMIINLNIYSNYGLKQALTMDKHYGLSMS